MKALEVEVRDGQIFHNGKPLTRKGKFYLIPEDILEQLKDLVRKRRNKTVPENSYKMSDKLREQLPPKLEVGDEFTYCLDSSGVQVIQGKFLYVRYKTLEEELDEILGEKSDSESSK